MKDPVVIYRRPFATPSPLALLEPLFAIAALAMRRPWPADPWLRRRAQAEWSWARAESLRSRAYALVAVAEDMTREARELSETAEHWDRVGLELFHFAERIRPFSTWGRQ